MVRAKGLDVLIGASYEMKRRGLTHCLLIIGNGPLISGDDANETIRAAQEPYTECTELCTSQCSSYGTDAGIVTLLEGSPNHYRRHLRQARR
jgi:hypothetical protein